MAAPLPAEFKELIVKPTDLLRDAQVKAFVRFPVLFARWYRSVFNEDGTFTEEFKAKLCEACENFTPST